MNIASRVGSVSPYGDFPGLVSEGVSGSSEKRTKVNSAVKSPFL